MKNNHNFDPLFPNEYFGVNPHPYEVIFFKSNRNITPQILSKYIEFHNYQTIDLADIIFRKNINTDSIIIAKYGADGKYLDVTNIVKNICQYQPNFVVSNQLFTDLVPNVTKNLRVTMSNGLIKIISENNNIEVNELLTDSRVPMSCVFTDLSFRLSNLKGLEIGGPSPSITKLGIYNAPKCLDNVNYTTKTLWNVNIAGSTYSFNGKTNAGQVYLADVVDLKIFQNHEYDFIVASHVLEHLVNPLLALKEITRILKPNGFCLLILPDKQFTFDHHRPTTTFQELLQHYQNNRNELDVLDHLDTIVKDYDLSMDPSAGTMEHFIERCHHHDINQTHVHVFDFQLIIECLKYFNYSVFEIQLVKPFHQLVIARLGK